MGSSANSPRVGNTRTVSTRGPLPQTSTFREAITNQPSYPRTQQGNDQRVLDYGGYAVDYDAIAQRQVWEELANLGTTPAAPAAPGPGGARPRGSGNPMVDNFGGYSNAVMNALRSAGQRPATPFGMAAPVDTLTPRVNSAVDADLAFAQKTMGGVDQRTSDPYAGLEFFAQQFDPGTSGVLGAQGAGVGAATAQQMAGQSDQDYTAQLFNNIARTMSANQQSSNQAWNADLQRDSAATANEISGQRTGLLAAAGIRQEDAQRTHDMQKMQWEADQAEKQRQEDWMRWQAVLELLGSGWQAGADVSGVRF